MMIEIDKLRDAICDEIEDALGTKLDSYDVADRLIARFSLDRAGHVERMERLDSAVDAVTAELVNTTDDGLVAEDFARWDELLHAAIAIRQVFVGVTSEKVACPWCSDCPKGPG